MLKRIVGKGRRICQSTALAAHHQVERILGSVPAPPKITARSAYLMDPVTGACIFAKNAHFKLSPASTIKLALGIAVFRSGLSLDERAEVRAEDLLIGSSMHLRVGDLPTCRDLLYGLMLASGNDAAAVLARMVGDAVAAMNRIARDAGMTRTRFVNPHGMEAPGQFSTAHDLALLTAAAMEIPELRKICGTRAYEAQIAGAQPRRIRLETTVANLGDDFVVAGKTGSTPRSKAGLTLLLDVRGRPLVLAMLGSDVAFDEKVAVRKGTDRRYADVRTILAAYDAMDGETR